MIGKKTIVYETYDEMIFQDPSPMMLPLLTSVRQLHLGPYKHHTNFKQREEEHTAKLEEALKKVAEEIQSCKELVLKKREEVKNYRTAIELYEKNQSSYYNLEN